jgi:hypothetical protein
MVTDAGRSEIARFLLRVGAVPIEEGRVVLGAGMYTLVRTTWRSEHGAVLVQKLRVPDLVDAPPLDVAIDATEPQTVGSRVAADARMGGVQRRFGAG